jgi:predicted neutral ceramidase superfamily lipid hydrolase
MLNIMAFKQYKLMALAMAGILLAFSLLIVYESKHFEIISIILPSLI